MSKALVAGLEIHRRFCARHAICTSRFAIAAPATKPALLDRGSRSAAIATKPATGSAQSAVPATKSALPVRKVPLLPRNLLLEVLKVLRLPRNLHIQIHIVQRCQGGSQWQAQLFVKGFFVFDTNWGSFGWDIENFPSDICLYFLFDSPAPFEGPIFLALAPWNTSTRSLVPREPIDSAVNGGPRTKRESQRGKLREWSGHDWSKAWCHSKAAKTHSIDHPGLRQQVFLASLPLQKRLDTVLTWEQPTPEGRGLLSVFKKRHWNSISHTRILKTPPPSILKFSQIRHHRRWLPRRRAGSRRVTGTVLGALSMLRSVQRWPVAWQWHRSSFCKGQCGGCLPWNRERLASRSSESGASDVMEGDPMKPRKAVTLVPEMCRT